MAILPPIVTSHHLAEPEASGPARFDSALLRPDRKSRRLGVPIGRPLSLFGDAAFTIAFLTVAGDAVRLFWR